MERMTTFEKNMLINLIDKNSDILENRKIDSLTTAAKVQCWMRIEEEFNSDGHVTKRSWRQLRKAWDNMKTKRRRKQVQETKREMATGDSPFTACTTDPTPELEVAIPLLADDDENVGDSDDIQFALDVITIPSESGQHTEYVPIEKLQATSDFGQPINIVTIPFAEPAMGGSQATSTSSLPCSMTRTAALETELEARLGSLKSYSDGRDRIQALRQEAVETELTLAKRNLQFQDLQQKLQLQILQLQKRQLEKAISHKEKMDALEIEIKERQLRQLKKKYTQLLSRQVRQKLVAGLQRQMITQL